MEYITDFSHAIELLQNELNNNPQYINTYRGEVLYAAIKCLEIEQAKNVLRSHNIKEVD
jgi:hypothetical protein